MKKLLISALVLTMVVGLVFATTGREYVEYNLDMDVTQGHLIVEDYGENYVKFFNKVRLDKGIVELDQSADNFVSMYNDVRIQNQGILGVEQDIDASYASLDNDVYLRGSNVHFLNMASEKWRPKYKANLVKDDRGLEWVDDTRSIRFANDFLLEEREFFIQPVGVSMWLPNTMMVAYVDAQLTRWAEEYVSQELLMGGVNVDGKINFWNDTLFDGRGQFGVFNRNMLPDQVGGKAFITSDFEAFGNLDGSERYFWAESTALVNGNYSRKEISELSSPLPHPNRFDVDVDNFSVSWNGDWS